ncbi:MAG: adenylate/guanylate cyclase domain-containing protein, partial [Myxococcota bacterium]
MFDGGMEGFVPERYVQRLGGDQIVGAWDKHNEAALLFLDLAGFSALTEQLSEMGEEGAAAMLAHVNEHFGSWIALVERWGGDVLRFAGDALIVAWVVREEGVTDLGHACSLAACCALEIAQESNDENAESWGKARIGLVGGDVRVCCVGGVEERWECVTMGSVFATLKDVMRCVGVGEVGCSSQVQEHLVQEGIQWARQERTDAQKQTDTLHEKPTDAQHVAVLSLEQDLWRPYPDTEQAVQRASQKSLDAYLPEVVPQRLAYGRSWLAEMRSATVLFLRLEGVFEESRDFAQIQRITRALQEELLQYEGALDKLWVDEKGAFALVGFGVPPSPEDQAEHRALLAAQGIQQRMEVLGCHVHVGVASGRLFCGPVGNLERCEYTLMGRPVNLAARLMQRAENEILCDAHTLHKAQESATVHIEWLDNMALKGFSRTTTPARVRHISAEKTWLPWH